MSAKTKVTKTKTPLKQETVTVTYNVSDLKHDPDWHKCGFQVVDSELGDSVSVSS